MLVKNDSTDDASQPANNEKVLMCILWEVLHRHAWQ